MDQPWLQIDAEAGAQQLEHDPFGLALLFAVPRREGKWLGRQSCSHDDVCLHCGATRGAMVFGQHGSCADTDDD
jgi:hypothetical protein